MRTKRFLSLFLALALTLAILPFGMFNVSASILTLSELRQKFPHGKYWNGRNADSYTSTPCTHHGSCTYTGTCGCNSFLGLSIQCMGYAEKLAYDATGYNPRNNANGWYTYTSSSALDNLKPGDIVRYKNNVHSIYVIGVNGDTVTYTDCNNDGHCIIRWDATISKSTLRSTFTHVRSAPASVSPGSISCSCSTSYAGTYICTTSSLNLTIRSGHGSSYSAIGSIPPGATVTVSKASGTGNSDWAHVTYNGVAGYASMQYLSKKQVTPQRDSRIGLWLSDSEMGGSISTIRTGEWLYLCYRLYDANTGDLLDTYNTSGGYTAKLTLYETNGAVAYTYTYTNDNNWISIRRNTSGNYKGELVFTWNSGGTTTSTVSINMVYEPRVTPSVSDIQLDVKGTNTQTISISYSGATSSNSIYLDCTTSGDCFSYKWGSWSDHKMPLTITGVRAGQGVITIEMYDYDTDQIIATSKVYITVTAPTYTVSYNANGGTGVPYSQTKDYGKDLTLSTTMPTRSGYTFLGWSTSSTATSATYSAGGTFTVDANTTLYAVWRLNPTQLSVNTSNSAVISTAGEMKYYTYTPTTTGDYVIFSTGSVDTTVYLYDVNGNQITYNDDGGSGNNFRLQYTLTAGTTYKFGIKYYSSSTTGTIPFGFGRVYTISYNANGGTGAPSPQAKDFGTYLALSSTIPTRSGYTFLGWATSSTATTHTYSPGGTFTVNANTTLYAVWSRNSYTVTYNANGGTSAPSSQIKYYGQTLTLSTTTPTRTGYTFLGWSTSSTATSATYSAGGTFTVNANTTLYAVWKKNSDFVFELSDDGTYYIVVGYEGTDTAVEIPSTYCGVPVKEIGTYAFDTCRGLISVRVSDSVITIRESAFVNCFELVEISIGKSVERIGHLAFSGCKNLEIISVDEENIAYRSMGNCLIEKETKTLVLGSNNSVIPGDGTVTAIGDFAFDNYDGIISIKIPDSVTTIGDSAFFACRNLTEVQFGNSIINIGSDAFSLCYNLTDIEIPDSVTTIGDHAFYGCERLRSITIPDSVTTIGDYAFVSCENLTDIYCEADSKPFGWSNDWNYGCYATVHRGCNFAKITTQPKSVVAQSGKIARVTVNATGEGLTYKWYFKNKGDSKFTLTNSYKSNTYSLEMNGTRAGRQVYCVITDKYGNEVKTNTVTLGMAVKITKQPTTVSVQSGKQAKVTVSASGEGKTYKWYYKDKNASKFTLTNSFKGDSYYIEMNGTRAGRQVYCVITDKYGNSVKTNTVTLGMAVKITKQPTSVTVANGSTAKVTVSASGEGKTYKWYFKDKGLSKFYLTTSFKGATYSVTMTNARAGRQVYCVITDKYGNSVKTNIVTLNKK